MKDLQSRKQPGTVELLQVDVDSEESIIAAAKTVESKHGRYVKLTLSWSQRPLDAFAEVLTKEQTGRARKQRCCGPRLWLARGPNGSLLPDQRNRPSTNG